MKQDYNEEPVFYCTKCMSLNIKDKDTKNGVNVPYCDSCGADVKYIDITSIDKWEKLYINRLGHNPLDKEPDKYSDLGDVYREQAEEVMTEQEALNNGMIVGDFINRNLHEK